MSLGQRIAARFSSRARLAYAISLLESETPARGVALLSRVASDGDPEAQYRIGRAYLEGTGVPPSPREGARWMLMAAEAGRVDAQFMLATLYAMGVSPRDAAATGALLDNTRELRGEPDYGRALPWARKAADGGSPEAQAFLGYLLIFLGLLGTFYGLLLTLGAIAGVISSMSVGNGDIGPMFEQLKSGLARPLHGMATAFSGSMFGLASALVLGFLDLTAGQAQNRFFNELEEWLATVTRIGGAAVEGSDQPIPAYVQALLEQTAENLETLQNVMSRGEEGRVRQLQSLDRLQERLGSLTELLQANREMMARNHDTQTALLAFLRHTQDAATPGTPAFEEGRAQRDQLRAIEHQISRVIEELHQGRAQATGEIRNDLRLLARTIAAASGLTTEPGRS